MKKPAYDNDISLIFLSYVVRMSFNHKLSKSINNATNMKYVDILSISRLLWGRMNKNKYYHLSNGNKSISNMSA